MDAPMAALASHLRSSRIGASTSGDVVFVASGLDQDGVLQTIDRATGRVVDQDPFTDRWRNTLPAYFDVLTVSSDDRWIYALGFQAIGAERDGYYVRVFDIERGEFLEDEIPLPDCIGGLVLPGSVDIEIVCPHSGVLLSATVAGNGSAGVLATTEISRSGLVGAARLPGRAGTIVLTKEGNVVRVDQDGVHRLFKIGPGLPAMFDGVILSPDGRTLFVTRGTTSGTGMISAIESYDLAGAAIATSKLDSSAWTATLSQDGTSVLLPVKDGG